MSGFQEVKRWMEAVGQPTPSDPEVPPEAVLRLRERLITDEFVELTDAWVLYLKERTPENLVKVLEEAADLKVTLEGLFVDFGVDGDAVFNAVHGLKNFGKVPHRRTEPDGKIVVPQQVKDGLRAQMNARLRQLIGAEGEINGIE